MILVDNYFLAILCCVICCACWGSWANTQKMVAAKQWSFELFYCKGGKTKRVNMWSA